MDRISKRPTVHIGSMDAPVVLRDGGHMRDTRFVIYPMTYGRVLFSSGNIALMVEGRHNVIENCEFIFA